MGYIKLKIFCRSTCFLPGRAKDLPAPLYRKFTNWRNVVWKIMLIVRI